MSNQIDIARMVLAAVHHWHNKDQGEAYCLQIEPGNDYGITLTVSEKEPPSVSVCHGSRSHSFVRTDIERGETLEGFREFVAAAFEPQPPRAEADG